jgi:hypothetical protein
MTDTVTPLDRVTVSVSESSAHVEQQAELIA